MTPDLECYFTETWFNGSYHQIPLFIYGFFNQLCLDLYSFLTVLGGDLTETTLLARRSVSQIMSEVCTQIVKALVDRMVEMIKERYPKNEGQE